MQAIVQMPSSEGLCAICPIRGSSTPAHAVPSVGIQHPIPGDMLALTGLHSGGGGGGGSGGSNGSGGGGGGGISNPRNV